jgi:hypothetical protein
VCVSGAGGEGKVEEVHTERMQTMVAMRDSEYLYIVGADEDSSVDGEEDEVVVGV